MTRLGVRDLFLLTYAVGWCLLCAFVTGMTLGSNL